MAYLSTTELFQYKYAAYFEGYAQSYLSNSMNATPALPDLLVCVIAKCNQFETKNYKS